MQFGSVDLKSDNHEIIRLSSEETAVSQCEELVNKTMQSQTRSSSASSASSSPSPSISSANHAVANLLNLNTEPNANNLPLFNPNLFHSFGQKYSSPAALMAAYQSVLHQLNFGNNLQNTPIKNQPNIEVPPAAFSPNMRNATAGPNNASSNYQYLDLTIGQNISRKNNENNGNNKDDLAPDEKKSINQNKRLKLDCENSSTSLAKKRGLSDVISQLRNQQVKQETSDDEDDENINSRNQTLSVNNDEEDSESTVKPKDEIESLCKTENKNNLKSAESQKSSSNKAEIDLYKLLERANLIQYLQAFTQQGKT